MWEPSLLQTFSQGTERFSPIFPSKPQPQNRPKICTALANKNKTRVPWLTASVWILPLKVIFSSGSLIRMMASRAIQAGAGPRMTTHERQPHMTTSQSWHAMSALHVAACGMLSWKRSLMKTRCSTCRTHANFGHTFVLSFKTRL